MGINLYRKFFHIFWGLFLYFLSSCLSFLHFTIFLIFLFFLLTLFEIFRLYKPYFLPLKSIWQPLLKKEEKDRFNDAWFFLAGVIISWFFLDLKNFQTIVLILAFSDPFASIIGHSLGRKKLKNNKTLEGSLTFFTLSLIITYFQVENFSFSMVLFCLILSLTEVFTKRDNFWIPVIGSIYLKIFI